MIDLASAASKPFRFAAQMQKECRTTNDILPQRSARVNPSKILRCHVKRRAAKQDAIKPLICLFIAISAINTRLML